MSKAKTPEAVVGLQEASLGQIWAFADLNPGRDDPESWGIPEVQIPPDMSGGYDISKGAMVAHPFGYFDKATQKRAMQERLARIAEWTEKGDEKIIYSVPNPTTGEDMPASITYAEAAAKLAEVKDVPIIYWIVCGQRRTAASVHSVILADKRRGSPAPFPFWVDVRPFVSWQDTHLMQLEENAENARLAYSDVGKFRNVCQLLDENPALGEAECARLVGLLGEVDLTTQKRKTNKRGLVQKIYRWATLNRHFALGLYQRVTADKVLVKHGPRKGFTAYVKGGYVPLAKLDKEDGQSLLGKKKEKGKLSPTPGVKAILQGKAPTKGHCEDYFEVVITGAKVKASVMGRKEIERLADDPTLMAVKTPVGTVLKAIVAGDTAFFAALVPKAAVEE